MHLPKSRVSDSHAPHKVYVERANQKPLTREDGLHAKRLLLSKMLSKESIDVLTSLAVKLINAKIMLTDYFIAFHRIKKPSIGSCYFY